MKKTLASWIAGALMISASSVHASPLIRDAEIEHTLRAYGDPLFRAGGLKPSAVHLFVVQDERLNAFVAGGANMFIHTGMILQCDTPDMLIGVMAHETGHIIGGHLARGGEKLKDAQMGSIMTFVLGAAAAAASGRAEAASAILTGGQTTVMRNFFAFTRANEEAADQSALKTLDSLGISASGMVKTFELLQRNERSHGGSPDPYMITHPLTTSRIDHVRNHAETSRIPEGTYPKQFEEMHQRMVGKLYGFLNTPERTLARYPKSNTSAGARIARAVAYYKMPDLPQALAELDGMMAQRPNDGFLYELKGQILFENNKVKDALGAYQTAAQLAGNSALILADLGRVELAQTPPMVSQAVTHLEQSVALDSDNAPAWRQLAIAYGKAGNEGLSALALAEEAMLYDNPETALKQSGVALTHIKGGTPAAQRARDLEAAARKRQQDKKDNS